MAVVFGAGLLYWGNRFKAHAADHDHRLRRRRRRRPGRRRPRHQPPRDDAPARGGRRGHRRAVGLFVLAGATPAALGLLADMSERFPTDRGAIMGLYSVFLALGQIIGSLIGGVAADWLGIDGMFIATLAPARHRGRAAGPAADAGAPARAAPAARTRPRRDPGVTPDAARRGPVAAGARLARGRRRAEPPRDRPPAWRSCGPAGAPSMRRSRPTPSWASSSPPAAGSAGTGSG